MPIKPLFKTVLHGKITETDSDVCWSKDAGTYDKNCSSLVSTAFDLKLLKRISKRKSNSKMRHKSNIHSELLIHCCLGNRMVSKYSEFHADTLIRKTH